MTPLPNENRSDSDPKIYAIFSDQSGLDGIPIYLEVRMFEKEITGDPFSDVNSIYYEWMKPGYSESSFADPLYLYTKNEKFAFDYRFFTSDFILSENFLKLANRFGAKYTASKLYIHPAYPNQQTKIQKKYLFTRFDYTEDAVDFDKSICEFAKTDKGENLIHNGVRYVKKYEKIVLRSDINSDLFLIKDPILDQNLFCTENFKKAAENAGLYGLLFVPLEEFIDFKTYSGFLGKETYERLKAKRIK